MSERYESPEPSAAVRDRPWRIGVVVHPSRVIERPLAELRRWVEQHGAELVQIPVPGQDRVVAELGDAEGSDLVVSIGGDGTMLAAIRAAAPHERPVMGVACGSLGELTTVAADNVAHALDRFSRREWLPRSLPALDIVHDGEAGLFAINDLAIVRPGEGQVRVTSRIDGVLFARIAGDGCVVSTPTGSSAYALAAGGPLIAPGTDAYLFTPLSTHGGFCPPAVVSAASELQLESIAGHGGARLEIDGQVTSDRVGPLSVSFRPAAATLVGFADDEPFLSGLRRRRIVIDSPRFPA